MPLLALTVVLAAGCSRKDAPVERKEPWAAQPSAASAGALRARYTIEPRCEAAIELPAREATPRGTLRVCRGELDLDLLDLSQTRGSVAVDVASIEMHQEPDGGRSDDATQQAQSWLDVGSSRPEAERDRLRWATFTLDAIEEASALTAHEGKREKPGPDPRGSPPTDDPTAESGAPAAERRSVTLTAKGQLVLHDRRVETALPLRVDFHYGAAAAPDAKPERIEITTRRPLAVPLETHDIRPRDSTGTALSEGMKLLGTKVGKTAMVRLTLGAKLAR